MRCADPVEAHEQCGGYAWAGSTCCEDGLACVFMAEFYSEVGRTSISRHSRDTSLLQFHRQLSAEPTALAALNLYFGY